MAWDHADGMKSFFEPSSVAVAGVSQDPNKLGSIIFANLLENVEKGILKAPVYALNPSHDRIGQRPCYPDIRSLPETPELLIVAVPVSLTPALVSEAARAGVKAAILVSSGYAEAGNGDLEAEIQRLASKHGMRILGPNTIGLLDTQSGVVSLFLRATKTLPDGTEVAALLKPLKGDVVVITQSGHLGEIIAEELAANGIGIRALVGTGNQLDVSVEDVIRYFADDHSTKMMAVYLEGVRDGRRFMRAAAYATKKKPLVVFKVGKTQVGARAAMTHTASLVGNYQVYSAAFRQAGAVEAANLEELLDYCVSFSMLPRAGGRRLVIVTNAGGVGAIAADEAERSGLNPRPLAEESKRRVRSVFGNAALISSASLHNPIDLTASANTEELVKVCNFAIGLRSYDLALIIPAHQAPAVDHDVATRLKKFVSKAGKPVCVCVMGSADLAARIRGEFMASRIPSFPTPERAVRALSVIPEYEALRKEARAPSELLRPRLPTPARHHGPLPQKELSRLLKSYGVGEPRSVIVRHRRELGRASSVGFPVACKILSSKLPHKTDAGGVILNVTGTAELESAFSRLQELAVNGNLPFDGVLVQQMLKGGFEAILGETRDPTFGPVVIFGVGGAYTELTRDYSLAVAPVTSQEARAMVSRGSFSRVLEGFRGMPAADLGMLCRIISRFSRIMVEHQEIEQVEVNPLTVKGDEILAVDARAVLA